MWSHHPIIQDIPFKVGSHHPWTLSSPTLQSGAPSNSAFCKAASNSSRPWDDASRWKFLRVGDLIRMICVEAQVKVLSFVCNRFCLGIFPTHSLPLWNTFKEKKKKTSQHLPAAISSEETLFFLQDQHSSLEAARHNDWNLNKIGSTFYVEWTLHKTNPSPTKPEKANHRLKSAKNVRNMLVPKRTRCVSYWTKGDVKLLC